MSTSANTFFFFLGVNSLFPFSLDYTCPSPDIQMNYFIYEVFHGTILLHMKAISHIFEKQYPFFFISSLSTLSIDRPYLLYYTFLRRRQWHPTPVLLPGKSHGWGVWWAAVHGVTKSRTRLSYFTFTFPLHALEEEIAAHSSVLAWRIPGTGEPGGLPSMGLHRVGHD